MEGLLSTGPTPSSYFNKTFFFNTPDPVHRCTMAPCSLLVGLLEELLEGGQEEQAELIRWQKMKLCFNWQDSFAKNCKLVFLA